MIGLAICLLLGVTSGIAVARKITFDGEVGGVVLGAICGFMVWICLGLALTDGTIEGEETYPIISIERTGDILNVIYGDEIHTYREQYYATGKEYTKAAGETSYIIKVHTRTNPSLKNWVFTAYSTDYVSDVKFALASEFYEEIALGDWRR